MWRLLSEQDNRYILGKLRLTQICVRGGGASVLGLARDRAGRGILPLCWLAVTFSQSPSPGSVSLLAWCKLRDNRIAGLGGSVFCYRCFAASLLRLKFFHRNIWLLNSVFWQARDEVNLLLSGDELCISVILGLKKPQQLKHMHSCSLVY